MEALYVALRTRFFQIWPVLSEKKNSTENGNQVGNELGPSQKQPRPQTQVGPRGTSRLSFCCHYVRPCFLRALLNPQAFHPRIKLQTIMIPQSMSDVQSNSAHKRPVILSCEKDFSVSCSCPPIASQAVHQEAVFLSVECERAKHGPVAAVSIRP